MAYEALYDFLKTEYAKADKKQGSFYRLTADGTSLPEEDKKAYDFLREISSLYKNHRTDDTKGDEYFPGHRVSGAIFSLEDITEDEIMLLKSLDYDHIPVLLSSKVCDVVWLVSKDYKYAVKAAKYLIKLFDETLDSENWVDCVEAIERAITLSKKVNADEVSEDAFQKIYDSIVAVDGTDTMFFTIRLLELLIQYKYGTKEQKEKCLYLTDRVIENTISRQPVRVDKVEMAYKIKEKLLNQCGKNKHVTACRLEYADFLVKEADAVFSNSRDVHNSIRYLTEAVKIYRNNGEQGKAEETHKKLIEAQSHVHETMHVFSKQIDVSSIHNYTKEVMENLSFKEKLVYLILVTKFNDADDIKQKLLDGAHGSFFTNIFPTQFFDKNGQTVITLLPLDPVNPDEKALQQHMYWKATESNGLTGDIGLRMILENIRQSEFSEDDLQFIFDDNHMVPEGREKIWRTGIYLGLKGDYYLALHILCPQIENFFREIAKMCGDIVVTLDDDGTSQNKVLSTVLDLPHLNECYDPNIIFTFKALLDEKTGANLRNLIAHGLVDEKEANGGVSIYLLCAAIKLIAQTSAGFYEICNTSESLKCSLAIKYNESKDNSSEDSSEEERN